MSVKIKLDCFGIEITLTGDGGGSITSDLQESAQDGSAEEIRLTSDYNLMMDAIESMILAHAVAGIDVSSPAYLEGIETACQSCAKATE